MEKLSAKSKAQWSKTEVKESEDRANVVLKRTVRLQIEVELS